MRRLPVFFVLDVSESMVGENHAKLEDGLRLIVRELRQNPHALETVYLSVIVFAGKARTLVPLTELIDFTPPELPIGQGTSLGVALDHLTREINKQVRKATTSQKGDWKPLIFLMTDGHPTEDAHAAVARWNSDYKSKAHVVAITIGADADSRALRQITDDILVFEETSGSDLTQVIKWISQSIQTHSRSIDNFDTAHMADPETSGLRRVNLQKDPVKTDAVDDRFAIIIGKCQNTHLPYILKYEKHESGIQTDISEISGLFSEKKYYFKSAYALRRSFFELSCDSGGKENKITVDYLIGAGSCPHCMNQYGFTICGCSNIYCCSSDGLQSCPWCGHSGMVTSIDTTDSLSETEINRSQG